MVKSASISIRHQEVYIKATFLMRSGEVTLRLTVGRSVGRSVIHTVCLGIEHPYETCDQILFPVGMLLSEIYGLVSVGRPLWREDGSAICSVITHWSESRRTRNRSRSQVTTDGHSVSMSRYRAHSGTCDQILLSVWSLFSERCCPFLCRAPSLTRGRVCHLSFSVCGKLQVVT
jgi:hypothetical protein